jgi:hypothetical protein
MLCEVGNLNVDSSSFMSKPRQLFQNKFLARLILWIAHRFTSYDFFCSPPTPTFQNEVQTTYRK